MCPIAKAIVNTVNPKASATPANPMPSPGKAAASTALPHPPNTNQKVPKNSAAARLLRLMGRYLNVRLSWPAPAKPDARHVAIWIIMKIQGGLSIVRPVFSGGHHVTRSPARSSKPNERGLWRSNSTLNIRPCQGRSTLIPDKACARLVSFPMVPNRSRSVPPTGR
jgi:hypothetical protein